MNGEINLEVVQVNQRQLAIDLAQLERALASLEQETQKTRRAKPFHDSATVKCCVKKFSGDDPKGDGNAINR